MKAFYIKILVVAFLLFGYCQAKTEEVYVEGFQKHQSFQETPVWCWAACIQMVYGTAGVEISQKEIVQAVKGRLTVETASDFEIVAALNAIGVAKDGTQYRSISTFHRGAPYIPGLLNELKNDRPVIVSYLTGPFSGHVVMIYRARFINSALGPIIQMITIFDPYSGKSYEIEGSIVGASVMGTWYAGVVKTKKSMSTSSDTKETLKRKPCWDCDGKGHKLEEDVCPADDCLIGDVECSRCEGSGEIDRPDGSTRECYKCKGKGNTPCIKCKGTGKKVMKVKCETCEGKRILREDN